MEGGDDVGKGLSVLEIGLLLVLVLVLSKSLASLGNWLSTFTIGGDKVAQHDPNKPGIPIGLGGGVGESAPTVLRGATPAEMAIIRGDGTSSGNQVTSSDTTNPVDEAQANADSAFS